MSKTNKKQRQGSIQVQRLSIPVQNLKDVSDEDRYSYYLLSHMFNELMCLQKLIHFTLPRHGDRRPIRFHPEMAQAQFMFRIALGKVSEVRDELEKNKNLEATFAQLIRPKWAQEQQQRATLFEKLDAAPWLKKLRNKLGFHFPTFNQWQPFIMPNDEWKDDEIFVSELSGNTFYDAANDVSLHWTLSLHSSSSDAVGSVEPLATERMHETVDSMITQMIDLITRMIGFLESALGAVVDCFLKDVVVLPPGEPVVAPNFLDVKIPFWTRMSSRPISN